MSFIVRGASITHVRRRHLHELIEYFLLRERRQESVVVRTSGLETGKAISPLIDVPLGL